jgi:hypothetical protein
MDLDLLEEAREAGYKDVDRYVQENPERAETFQGEFSLHLFRYKPEINDEGVYVGTPVDDAIDFACYLIQTLQRIGAKLGRPCLTIAEYLDGLRRRGIIDDTYLHKPNNLEIRTGYDPHLKKNLGHAAYRLFALQARPGESVSWIDDGVSAISKNAKLMLRYSNTSPKVTMKCDAKPSAWIKEAERLLGIYYAITDHLVEHRGLDKAYRTISASENELLYTIFREEAGKDLGEIAPADLGPHLNDPELKKALEAQY